MTREERLKAIWRHATPDVRLIPGLQLHTKNVTYCTKRRWLGAQIYGNSFSARSHFMEYTRDFETRLAEANKVRPGRGVLVFCSSGFEWHRSELEDFADFYRTGRHRQDDPFANMEPMRSRKWTPS